MHNKSTFRTEVSYACLPKTSLNKLRLSHVASYAERHGWQRGQTFRDMLVIFDRGPGSPDQLLVPTRPAFDDFAEAMGRVVLQLANAESRDPASVLDDLLSFDVGEAVSQAAEFRAIVDELRGVIGVDGRRQGDVRLTLFHEDEAVEASASLTADQYEVAARAHMKGWHVAIRCILNRRTRLSTVSGVQAFEWLDEQ